MSKKIIGAVIDVAAIGLMFVPGVGTALGLTAKLLGGAFTVAQAVGMGLMVADSLLLGPGKQNLPTTTPVAPIQVTPQ